MAGGVQVSHRAALRVGHRAVFGHVERRGRTCRSTRLNEPRLSKTFGITW